MVESFDESVEAELVVESIEIDAVEDDSCDEKIHKYFSNKITPFMLTTWAFVVVAVVGKVSTWFDNIMSKPFLQVNYMENELIYKRIVQE